MRAARFRHSIHPPRRRLVLRAGLWVVLCALGFPVLGQEAAAQVAFRDRVETLQGQVGVRVTKGAELAVPLCPTQNIRYTVRIENVGTVVGIARILDPIPAGTTFVQRSEAGGAVHNAAADRIEWQGALAPGTGHTIAFSVTVDPGVPGGTVLVNEATGQLIAGETPAQDTARIDVPVDCPPPTPEVGLRLRKRSNYTPPLCPGSRIRYQVELTNTSEVQGLVDARIEDAVPANTTLAEIHTGGVAPGADGDLVWSGKLASGKTQTLAFDVMVDDGVPNGAVLVNKATGEVSDPGSGAPAQDAVEIQDTVACVKETKETVPKVRQQVRLRSISLVDDGDPVAGCGDIYFQSWAKHPKDFRKVEEGGETVLRPDAQHGGNTAEKDICSGKTEGFVPPEQIFLKDVCCPVPPLELAIDFWDDDDEAVDKIAKVLEALGTIIDKGRPETGAVLEGLEAILEALGSVEDLDREDVGDFYDPALPQPESNCVLPDRGVESKHPIQLNGGLGEPNGEFTLLWQAFRLDETCILAQAEPSAGGDATIERLVATPRDGDRLQIETELVDLELTGGEPVKVVNQVEPVEVPPGGEQNRGPIGRAGTAAHGAAPWRVETTLSGGPGGLAVESEVFRWDDAWVPAAVEPVEVALRGNRLTVVLDRAAIGAPEELAVWAELSRGGERLGRLPADPGTRHVLEWVEDTMPPQVAFVRNLPGDEPGTLRGFRIGLVEAVDLVAADLEITPDLGFQLLSEDDERTFTVELFAPPPPGEYTLTVGPTVTDRSGNPLDGDGDGVGGDPHAFGFRVQSRDLIATGPDGTARERFAIGDPVFALGRDFPPGTVVDLYLVRDGAAAGGALRDRTVDGADSAVVGADGSFGPVDLSRAAAQGEYSLVADVDRDGAFRAAVDRLWREPGIGIHVVAGDDEPGPDDPPIPPDGAWLTSAELPDFEAKVRITPGGDQGVTGAAEPTCIVESLCVSGALAGRPEIFVKVIGPRPNGMLWTQISRFTPSAVEVWLRQVATGTIRYYRLDPVGPASDDVSGLQDREAFDPVGTVATVPRGALLPGGDVVRVALPDPLEPGEPSPPAGVDWLTTPELPGFRLKARITAGDQAIGGRRVDRCIHETLCIHGALAGRPEVFVKIIGPRPNGFLWIQAARFTPSQVELWVEQEATGTVRYYRLGAVGPRSDDVSGLQDRRAFDP